MEGLRTPNAIHYLRAQIASDTTELNKIAKELKPTTPSTSSPRIYNLKDKPEPAKRRGRKPKVANAGGLRAYSQYPQLLPVETPFEENKFINYYDHINTGRDGKGTWGNTGVDVGLMKRMGGGRTPTTVARH
jgi:hypothetical protein